MGFAMNDIEIEIVDGIFNLRACCILRNIDDSILFQKKKTDDNNQWALPGGKVQFGESSKVAIIREMKEEFDVDISDCKLVNIVEQSFMINNKCYHQIMFIYATEIAISDVTCLDDSINHCWIDGFETNKIKPDWLRHLSNEHNVNHSIYIPD